MATILYTDPAAAGHLTPPGHPEQVARISSVWKALESARFGGLDRRTAPIAEVAEVLRCHPDSLVRRYRAEEPTGGFQQLDPDTWMSPGTLEAALRGVGAACAAVDAVLAGEAGNAFVAMRPPGHHAETEKPMGFCLFGTVAIAAKRALDHHGLGRVAVLDFDVHHGNGTQDLLWNESRAFFASSHQWPLYPGTGRPDETGAHGQIMNVTLDPGSDGAAMRTAWQDILAAALDFRPELVIVSAGFDAHVDDPLAGLAWRTEDFAWLTQAICDLADDACGGRVVSSLEGGYDLDALGASVAAHVGVLMERGA